MKNRLKQVLLGTGAIVSAGLLIFGFDAFSYLSTAANQATSAVKSNVPIEFEIERAKKLVADLVPEIKENMEVISQEEIQLARLDEQVADLQDRMDTAKREILTLQKDLDVTSDTWFVYSGRSYTRSQVESDLANRFERYQIDEAQLDSLSKMQTVRQSSLDTAKKQLQSYLAQKRTLEVSLEQLAARLRMVNLAKTTSEYNFDSDALGRAKSLVKDLQARLDVEERLAGSSDNLANTVVLDAEDENVQNITQRVSKYFNGNTVPKLSKN